ncbi:MULTISPECIES: Gfo/Idh/MocA family oxidoreductase [Ignavibacterium]|jgi:predicted dehydrogenase|uniref:Gfo/Idh/MocA family protein n=1 Tax=Ignavibacterium TaxID=795750 RepID=UPI0025B7B4A8|nr:MULTISPECIES: Gfo/Idh/MocA family oxidoreductase [Ignavibacterium]MBI5663400.1 Gfo/Idh/MocA family oxidoreductase [Ignavibacterium album]
MVTELIKSRKLKWGVVGLGRFVENSFLPAVKSVRKSTVVSLCSRDLNRAKELAQKFGVPNYFNDYNEFLKSDIDVVYVASANAFHYEQVIKAANAGKHIFCEKPLALNSVQAEEMVEAAKKNNVQFAVNYVHHFHPLVLKAKELLKDQKLGKLVSVQVNFNIDFPPDNNFRFKKELSGGGALRDIGTHMIDLLRFFGGEIIEIDGVVDNLIYQSEVDDFASAIVKFEKGGYGYFNVSYNTRKAFNRIDILCHKGAIEIENLIGRKLTAPKLSILLEGEARKSFRRRGNKMVFVLKSVQKSFMRNELPLVTGQDGLINLKLIEELERKCQSKKN